MLSIACFSEALEEDQDNDLITHLFGSDAGSLSSHSPTHEHALLQSWQPEESSVQLSSRRTAGQPSLLPYWPLSGHTSDSASGAAPASQAKQHLTASEPDAADYGPVWALQPRRSHVLEAELTASGSDEKPASNSSARQPVLQLAANPEQASSETSGSASSRSAVQVLPSSMGVVFSDGSKPSEQVSTGPTAWPINGDDISICFTCMQHADFEAGPMHAV